MLLLQLSHPADLDKSHTFPTRLTLLLIIQLSAPSEVDPITPVNCLWEYFSFTVLPEIVLCFSVTTDQNWTAGNTSCKSANYSCHRCCRANQLGHFPADISPNHWKQRPIQMANKIFVCLPVFSLIRLVPPSPQPWGSAARLQSQMFSVFSVLSSVTACTSPLSKG